MATAIYGSYDQWEPKLNFATGLSSGEGVQVNEKDEPPISS